MDDLLKDSYKKYRAKGFILQESVKHKKFTLRKGAYKERTSEEFNPKATGYVAIIPKQLIIIDNDSYVDGNEFATLLDELGLEDFEIEPFCVTPSGGEHYAFENPFPNLVIGNHGFKGVDIYAGYQSVIPIVGTTVLNKQGKLNSYKWSNSSNELVVNDIPASCKEVLKMREESQKVSDNTYDEFSLAIKEKDMPLGEVIELCKRVPIETYGYDTGYLKFAFAMYDRFDGSDDGLELFQKTCERYEDNDPALNEKKWRNGNFIPNGKVTYKTLRSLANESEFSEIVKNLQDVKSLSEITSILEILKSKMIFTSTQTDEMVRDSLINIASEKAKEITGKPNKVAIKKAIKFDPPKSEFEKDDSYDIYRLNGKYLIRNGAIVIKDVSSQMLYETLYSEGIKLSKDDLAVLKLEVHTISSYDRVSDYLISSEYEFKLKKFDGHTHKKLMLKTNPLHTIDVTNVDEDVVHDFFEDIWNGKANDIIKIIALTIRFKEKKLNRLMTIAPSNAGKSEIFTHLNFQKIAMPRLLDAMRGTKGIGSGVIEGIRKSGLLLIDEANRALQPEIKDMDKELQIDQFGIGGTQILPLHFTALTSTHNAATLNNSDELYNRFLQVELLPSEMKHTVMESKLFIEDSAYYSDNVQKELFRLFKQYLYGDYDEDDLRELQGNYRLPVNTDLDDLMTEISKDYISDIKAQANSHGDILAKGDKYYIKRKMDAKKYFENKLGEIEALDIAKYSSRLLSHFITEDSKTVKVNGKPTKYYQLNMTIYSEDEEQKIIAEFDDLEEF